MEVKGPGNVSQRSSRSCRCVALKLLIDVKGATSGAAQNITPPRRLRIYDLVSGEEQVRDVKRKG